MVAKEGLRFVIELNAEEMRQFCKLAKTEDSARYEGIGKALLLGVGNVVIPEEVVSDVELLVELAEYGMSSDTPSSQFWADELLFTCAQLEARPVREAIHAWAVYFGSEIEVLQGGLHEVPFSDQLRWAEINAAIAPMTTALKASIMRRLHSR